MLGLCATGVWTQGFMCGRQMSTLKLNHIFSNINSKQNDINMDK